MSLNLTSAKTFRQYAAVEGVNHPPIHPGWEHAAPPGDAIQPNSVNEFTADAATDLLSTTAHGLLAGTRLRFTTTTTLPAGLSLATDYYVIASGLTADAFKVSATSGGSAVNITDAGTGTHSWQRYLTDPEQAQVNAWLINKIDAAVILPMAVAMTNAWRAYEDDPVHKAWVIDDYLQRHWQWLYRSADHADAAQTATPPSTSDTGTITTPPPTSPANVSPN